jgi:hypothetical protein
MHASSILISMPLYVHVYTCITCTQIPILLFVDWMVCKLLSTLLALRHLFRLSDFHASVSLGASPEGSIASLCLRPYTHSVDISTNNFAVYFPTSSPSVLHISMPSRSKVYCFRPVCHAVIRQKL